MMGVARLLGSIRRRMAWYAALLHAFYQAAPALSLSVAVLTLVRAAAPIGLVITSGMLVAAVPGTVRHGLNSPDGRTLWLSLAGLGLLLALQQMVLPIGAATEWALARRIDALLQRRL